jgi:hypothetical protein
MDESLAHYYKPSRVGKLRFPSQILPAPLAGRAGWAAGFTPKPCPGFKVILAGLAYVI